METVLMEKLYDYIKDNNPDLFMVLQEESKLTDYINDRVKSMTTVIQQWQAADKPNYMIEEACLAIMTEDLRPSKFHFINNVLEEEFETKWLELNNNGLLIYETINLIEACEPLFTSLGFTAANEDNQQLRNAIIGNISDYFETH